MDNNPFLRRATELVREDEAFIAMVSPVPVTTFLRDAARAGQLYDRLVLIRGTPGSGKTTLARLFQLSTLAALVKHQGIEYYKELVTALHDCDAIAAGAPKIVAARLPLETDYRDIWEFPYPEELKNRLLASLIQARAVLAWMRHFSSVGISADAVTLVPRADAEAATETIGGVHGAAVLERAKAVELAIYKITSALVPPDLDSLDLSSADSYRPFDVIEEFKAPFTASGETTIRLFRPLVILDDAHTLHRIQFRDVERWLAKREIRISRWILSRFDALTPTEALVTARSDRDDGAEMPGVIPADTLDIRLQSAIQPRRETRVAFRRMAKDMASRYLRRMPMFEDRELRNLGDLMNPDEQVIAPSHLEELQSSVLATQQKLSIAASRRAIIQEDIDRYAASLRTADVHADTKMAMLGIMMHRYSKRIPEASLFAQTDPEPAKPVKADKGVLDGARIQLLHRFDRPYYYGVDSLCDASSENAEQFLRLAFKIVDAASTRITRARAPSLSSAEQHQLLRGRATQLLREWDFPFRDQVNRVVGEIADRCLRMTLQPNAPLDAGANAFGIPRSEFEEIPARYPDLARVLQFAIAYNALMLVPDHSCKGQNWCLLELGGIVALHRGLTLARGGFVEGTAAELADLVKPSTETL